MKNLVADVRPSADVEYLASAIIRDALSQKFRDLFGRDPVYPGPEEPMRVDDARVPTMLSNSLDPVVVRLLTSSAVEATEEAQGFLKEKEGSTLVYTFRDDEPASVGLQDIAEYQDLDDAAVDATVSALNSEDDLNIDGGVAHLSPERSALDIGVFVDNDLFAQEFQYRLEGEGGEDLALEKKEEIFESLWEDLPGGDNVREPQARDALVEAVGLTSATGAGDIPQDLQAPGPGTRTQEVNTQT